MPRIPLQPLPPRAVESLQVRWLADLEASLADASVDRSDLCRDTLLALAHPAFVGR